MSASGSHADTPMQEGLRRIAEAIGRGNSRFALAPLDEQEKRIAGTLSPFGLAVGACRMVEMIGKSPSGVRRQGFVIHLGMTREHLLELRARIDELLETLEGGLS